MKRGDVVTVIADRDFGKPRPAVVIQSDMFSRHSSITVALMSSDLQNEPLIRVRIEPTEQNGLRRVSEVCVDKVQTLRLGRVGKAIGRLSEQKMAAVDATLVVFLGLA